MTFCTWKDCNNESEFKQIGKNDKEWANLCEDHDKELGNTINKCLQQENHPKYMLRAWVLASGGAKKMVGSQ